jgi:hypothetical protein
VAGTRFHVIHAAEEFLVGWTLLLHGVTSSAIHSTARPGLIGSVAHIGPGGNRAGDPRWRGSLIYGGDHASRVAVDPAVFRQQQRAPWAMWWIT